MNELTWLLLASRVAGIGLVIAFTLLLVSFLVWTCFNILEFQYKRLARSLSVQDVHEFAKDYLEWKAGRGDNND